ncbi:MAG: EF-hand domain-containing protein, partial [Verrucomicrobiota bacterium]
LYDYQTDPLETKNLAADHSREVKKLQALLANLGEAKPQISAATRRTSSAGTNRAALFERRDANRDGKLTREEFLSNQANQAEAKTRFERFDTDKDGTLSRSEFIQRGTR